MFPHLVRIRLYSNFILELNFKIFYSIGNIKTSAISIVKNSDNSRQDLFDRLYSNEYNLYKSNQVADERQLQNDNLNFPLYGDDDLMRDLISFNLDHNLRKKRRQLTSNLKLLFKKIIFIYFF